MSTAPLSARRFAYGGRLAYAGAAAVFVLLFLTSFLSYGLYHSFVELAFITVAFCVFAVAWTLREFLDDDFPLFIGIALLATGVLQAIHLLDFPGVGIITGSTDPPTQLWVASSFLIAVSLVVAPLVLGRRVSMGATLLLYGLVDALIVASIFWWSIFPAALVDGQGLTPFKRVSEYVVCALLVVAIVHLYRRRSDLKPGVFRYFTAALVARILASVFFAGYVGPETWPNMVGHLFLLLFAMLMYQAVVQASLTQPHALAVTNLRLTAEAARAEQRQEEETREALEQLLSLAPAFHAEREVSEIQASACSAACDLFQCDAVLLFDIDGDDLVLVAADPAQPGINGERVPVDEGSELGRQLRSHLPAHSTRCENECQAECGPADAEACTLQTRFGLRSVLRVPLGIGARADRMLVLGWSVAPPETSTRMIALAQRFGDQLDLALTQARRREAQARAEELHRRFERSLLPKLSAGQSSLRIGLHYQPGEPHLELGGDFIDVLESPAGIAVIVGDVCGHGPDAAALGATLRTAWGALLMSGMEMNEVAAVLSLVIERERPSSDLFATALLAQIALGENHLTLLNFGHPPPFLCHEGGAVPVAAPPHPPLGTFAGGQGQQLTMDLPPGWSLFFYTDGLVEARLTPSEEERFGEERLQKALQAFGCSFHDEDDLRRLMLTASDNGDVTVHDDVTVLVIAESDADTLVKTAAGSRPEVTRLS